MLLARAAELAAIDDALRTAREGRGRLLVFSGEAGIGKTRLAEEAAERARANGFRVAWGTMWEGAGVPPCWPWTQIVRALIEEGVPMSTAERSELAALVPELGTEVVEFRTYDALLRFVKRAARSSPRLLVLDDLHAADKSTLLALQIIARGIRELPIAVVATHREAEARIREDAASAFDRLAREGTCFSLARLTEADVAMILGSSPERARAVHRTTEGNPLFVHEIARCGPSVGALPGGIRSAIAAHLELLGAESRALLGTAALFGRTFSRAALETIHGAGVDAIDRVIREAAGAGILIETRDGGAFTHVLLAEALAAAIAPSERVRLHGMIAQWLRDRAHEEDRVTEIAHHLLEADGDPAEAIGWVRRAAARATQQLAYDRAAELYARALALVPKLRDGERVAVDLVIGRGDALAKDGAFEAALGLCKEAVRRARVIGAVDLEARAALAVAAHYNFMVANTDVVALLEGALAACGAGHDAWRAQLLAQLSSTLYPSPEPGRTLAFAREAVELSRRVADPAVSLVVEHETQISSLPQSLRAEQRIEMGRVLSQLAVSLNDAHALVRGRLHELIGELESGQVNAIDERLHALESTVRSSSSSRDRGVVALFRAMYTRLQGRFAEADACCEEAAETGLAEDRPRIRAIHLWANAYTRGTPEDLRAARALGELRMPAGGTTWVLAACGAHDEARARIRGAPLVGDFAWPAMVAAIADACVLAGDRESAPHLEELVAPAAGQLITFGPVISLGPADRILSGLASLRGDHAKANLYRESAIALSARVGAAPFLAKLRVSPPVERSLDLRREGEIWIVTFGSAEARLKDSKGLAYLAELVRRPDQELHVAELYGIGEGGDAGPMLDPTARKAYERRLEDLEEELREAEAFGDQPRASRAEEEIDRLAEELARAVGLGGRDRRAGSLTERARINVQRRLKDVITRIAKIDAMIARHLESAVKTGTFCSYRSMTKLST